MAKKTLKLSDQLRALIDASDKTRYRICLDTGIDQALLSRFMHGKAGLSLESLDALGECLALQLVASTGSAKPSRKQGK